MSAILSLGIAAAVMAAPPVVRREVRNRTVEESVPRFWPQLSRITSALDETPGASRLFEEFSVVVVPSHTEGGGARIYLERPSFLPDPGYLDEWGHLRV